MAFITMDGYTLEVHLKVIHIMLKNTCRILPDFFGVNILSNESTIQKLVRRI